MQSSSQIVPAPRNGMSLASMASWTMTRESQALSCFSWRCWHSPLLLVTLLVAAAAVSRVRLV